MQLIQAKCANCGAHLELSSTNNMVYCSSCGTPYLISNHEGSLSYKADSSKSSDFVIVGGELISYKGTSRDVVIPNNVKTIGKAAFAGSSITNVSLPNTVGRIREGAFADCTSLKEISIPSSVYYIHEAAFFNDKDLTIHWPGNWEYRRSEKLYISADTQGQGVYYLIDSKTKVFDHRIEPYFYCGKGKYYYFCDCSMYFRLNSRRLSAFDDFDVTNFDIKCMYDDLSLLFERAGLNKEEIKLVEVPTFGWSPRRNNGTFKVYNGKIQLFQIPLTSDPYIEDTP